ncbi:MAG: hypothetical protein AAGH64_02970 [Planctomycetota bacterium]
MRTHRSPRESADRPGVTLLETAIVLAVLVPAACLALPMQKKARTDARASTDTQNLRAIHAGLETFARFNAGRYPLPSAIDRSNATEFAPRDASEKDRTGNVWSLLVFNTLVVSPSVFVSPLETNPDVQIIPDFVYDYTTPGDPGPPVPRVYNSANTVDPNNAVYDPSFKGTPFDSPFMGVSDMDLAAASTGVVSNNSYAHVPLVGRYLQQWSALGEGGLRPLLSLRGPNFQDNTRPRESEKEWELSDDAFGVGSNTLAFLGPDDAWAGNVLLNDGSVRTGADAFFRDRPLVGKDGRTFIDNIFASEGGPVAPDALARNDTYIRTWAIGLDRTRSIDDASFNDPAEGAIWVD